MSRYSLTVSIEAPDRAAAVRIRGRIIEVVDPGSSGAVAFASDPMTEAEVA